MRFIVWLLFLASFTLNSHFIPAFQFKNYLKTVISDIQTQSVQDGVDPREIFHLKIIFKDLSFRKDTQTCFYLPKNIKSLYQVDILPLIFTDILDNLQNSNIKIFSNEKETLTEKQFIQKITQNQKTEKMMLLDLQGQITELKLQVKELRSKLQSQADALQKMKQNLINELKTMPPSQYQQSNFYFSNLLRGSDIVISFDGKRCEKNNQKYDGHQYVIVENSIGKKQQSISFRITKLVHEINLGVGLFNKIVHQDFQGNHGNIITYSIITSNNMIFSRHIPSPPKILNLTTGDIIDIKLDGLMIIFSKRGSIDRPIALSVEFTDEQWKRACFFVNLYTTGDTVEIVL